MEPRPSPATEAQLHVRCATEASAALTTASIRIKISG